SWSCWVARRCGRPLERPRSVACAIPPAPPTGHHPQKAPSLGPGGRGQGNRKEGIAMNPTPSIKVTSQPERKSRVGKVAVAVGGTVAAVAAIALLFGGEEAEAPQGAAPAVAAESSASVPQSCLDALDAADESHAIAARAFE